VIFEIQQNSDTTFRVHDWNRLGLDGTPRELHVAQSLESIDFGDFEPPLIDGTPTRQGAFTQRTLVDDPLFRVLLLHAETAGEWRTRASRLQVFSCVAGSATVRGNGMSETLHAGNFCLIPATVADTLIVSAPGAEFLMVEAG
jgi:mannose-6-phosphate isomerase